MALLNITYGAVSADVVLDAFAEPTDWDVRRLAVEAVRGGRLAGLDQQPALPPSAFDAYVVDRFTSPGGQKRIYLRPQVPFAGPRSA